MLDPRLKLIASIEEQLLLMTDAEKRLRAAAARGDLEAAAAIATAAESRMSMHSTWAISLADDTSVSGSL